MFMKACAKEGPCTVVHKMKGMFRGMAFPQHDAMKEECLAQEEEKRQNTFRGASMFLR